METLILEMLRSNGYPIRTGDVGNCTAPTDGGGVEPISCGPIILQNFDNNTVQYLSTVVDTPMVELMTLIHPNVYLLTPSGFAQIANFSQYICLWKEYMYTGVEAEVAFKGELVHINFGSKIIALLTFTLSKIMKVGNMMRKL